MLVPPGRPKGLGYLASSTWSTASVSYGCFLSPQVPLAGELEEQTTMLVRKYKTDRQFLSPHAPEEPGAHDDAPSMVAVGCLEVAAGGIGDIVIV
ncbi:MAG: hypothetical protein JWO38_4017 [Gemmataceae bacterium]|nr:hypothetical protein [Gemmataceae bacterium]